MCDPTGLAISYTAQGRLRKSPTISKQLQDGQVNVPLPDRVLLYGNAIASGGEHLPRANGDQLTALISTRHVVQHSRVIDKRIQFTERERERERENKAKEKHIEQERERITNRKGEN